MASERVERMLAEIDHLNRTGEMPLRAVTDDFVWDMSTIPGWPEQDEYRGAEGARRFMDEWLEVWGEWRLEIERVVEAGDEVALLARQQATARGSGVPADQEVAQVWTFRGDRAARMRMYGSHAEALVAIGATEPTP